MGIFNFLSSEEQQKCLYLRDDFKGTIIILPIRRKMIVREKDGEVIQAWPFEPKLRIRLYLNGVDHGMVYPICNRNAIIDPLELTGDELKGKKLWAWMQGIAAEEFHYARDRKVKDLTERATWPLAIGAGVMVIVIALVAAYQMYQ